MIAVQEKALVVGALSKCTDKEMLDKAFETFKVDDYEERISCMNECMGNPITFFSSGDNISMENKYNMTVLIFLEGSWKIAELIK